MGGDAGGDARGHAAQGGVILRRRKMEFDALLVLEAGKTWPEAEADVAEAIDFCDYYALQMLKLASPTRWSNCPASGMSWSICRLGWASSFRPGTSRSAILVGMTTAALVTGNTVVVKPSSDTPVIAARFGEVLTEAGFPDEAWSILVGSGAEVGDLLVEHPRTRFVSFTGSREVGLRINALAAKTQPGQIWIKRVVAEMGGKDAIVVDEEADLDAAVQGVLWSAFGFQGQKCSACSRAIVSEKLYEEFLAKLQAKVAEIRVGESEDLANYMGPVINERSRTTILEYIEIGKREGRLIAGGGAAPGEGYFVRPTVIADIGPSRGCSRKRSSGRCSP